MTTAKEAKKHVVQILNDETKITISEKDSVYGVIRNGNEGVIKRIAEESQPKKAYNKDAKQWEIDHYEDSVTEILRFKGNIGPAVKIDNETPGLKLFINNEAHVFDLEDARAFFRGKFSLTPGKTQKLMEVLTAFVFSEIESGNFENYSSSPIAIRDDRITVDYVERHDQKEILKILRSYYVDASHPVAFSCIFSFCLVAPLHDELKRRSIKQVQTPLVLLTGKTKGGKTTLETLFIGKGYELDKELYFYPYNRVYTRFTLMNKLKQTNLPAVFDDLPTDWIFKNKEDLKSYVQTGHFGDRGRGDQTETQYRGMRSFVGTVNDDYRPDDDLALSLRLLILWFTEYHRKRKNKPLFDKMFDSLPGGFMFEIFRSIFTAGPILPLNLRISVTESS